MHDDTRKDRRAAEAGADVAERRPRPVLDADARLLGHVAEVATDAAGKPSEILVDLTPEASEALLGPGRRHAVLSVPADEAVDARDAVRLLQNVAALKRGWQADEE